jgi:SAM-dependent methyltransferase
MKWGEEWWEELYYRIDSKRSQKYIAAESRSILEHLDLPPGRKILDVGCGYGSHGFMLEQLGMQVFSLDISMFFAGLVQERKEENGSSINFVLGDMRFLLAVENKSFYDQDLKRKGGQRFFIDNAIVKGEWEFDDESSLLKTEESVLKDNKQYKTTYCQKLYSLHEISDISRKCNLNIKHIFRNLYGDSFKKTSEKLVLVMEK